MSKSSEYGAKVRRLIPGGTHTYSKGDDQWPSNAPQVIARGKGCHVWDADGNRYIDWSMGLTSICLGHANDEINRAAIDAMAIGHNFQRPSTIEADAAEAFLDYLKDRGDMVKFAKNGSTVTTAAVKLARAFTGRDRVAICAEHPFFSYDDWFIGATKVPAGIPDTMRQLTVRFSYNDFDSVTQMFDANPGEIACLILEPAKFDPPRNGFLDRVYEYCRRQGALLVLDEMITGFKWANRGAAAHYGAKADLYTWGKGMANGHSVCALTGRRDVMELGGITHNKPRVFLSSTTHGAEIPQLAAMMKTLEIFGREPDLISSNWRKGGQLRRALREMVTAAGLADVIDFVGEDCFIALIVKPVGIHKVNVTRTYLLQELVREGQLFQGLFYPTPAHTDDAISDTLLAWERALPRFARFIREGARSDLVGDPTKPVFRRYNDCECLTSQDCESCFLRERK